MVLMDGMPSNHFEANPWKLLLDPLFWFYQAPLMRQLYRVSMASPTNTQPNSD